MRRRAFLLFAAATPALLAGCGERTAPLPRLDADAVVLAFGDSLTQSSCSQISLSTHGLGAIWVDDPAKSLQDGTARFRADLGDTDKLHTHRATITNSTVTGEIATYRRIFGEKFFELDQVLADLPISALLYRPFETSPWHGPAASLGWLVAHAVSSTVYLLRRAEWTLGRIEWQEVDGDEGREEFGPANHDLAYLQERTHRGHEFVERFLASLTEDFPLRHARSRLLGDKLRRASRLSTLFSGFPQEFILSDVEGRE